MYNSNKTPQIIDVIQMMMTYGYDDGNNYSLATQVNEHNTLYVTIMTMTTEKMEEESEDLH